jgi:hypothetical protein
MGSKVDTLATNLFGIEVDTGIYISPRLAIFLRND